MPVRKTESIIPVLPGYTIDDLGQHAASAANAKIQIISYLTSPLGINILQNYVVFVEDTAVQPNVASYEWVFNNNGTITTIATTKGVASYTPTIIGNLSVTVNLKSSANATLNTVALLQQVTALNLELEQLIDQEGSRIPSAGNPVLTREVINSLRIYADSAASPATDTEENRLILSLIYSTISASTSAARNSLVENTAAAIETNRSTFFSTAKNGIGITKLRPHLACMYILNDTANPLIPITELPAGAKPAQIKTTDTTISTAFNALTEAIMIDVFNLLRFPKSNIKVCKLVLDKLQKKYLPEGFPVLMSKRPKGRRLITQYEKGPYALPSGSSTSDLSATSDRIFSLTLMAAWRISVSVFPGGSGTVNPQTRVFGVPEPIPEKTFIAAGDLGGDPNFIASGENYHRIFDINFTTVRSLENIIDLLQTNTTIVNHLRIFTHANEDLLAIPLFTGGGGYVATEHLDGFVKGELEVAVGIINLHFKSTGGYIHKPDKADRFHATLKNTHNPAIVPFGLDVAGVNLSVELRELFRRYMDMWLVKMPGAVTIETTRPNNSTRNLTATEVNNVFIPFLELIVRLLTPSIKASIPGLTDAHFTALKQAILALSPDDVGVLAGKLPFEHDPFLDDPFPDNNFSDMIKDFQSAVRALAPGNTFFTKLQRVRDNTFNATSFIDIRGCMAGKQPPRTSPPPPLLVSVQKFFGKAGSLPTVSAPEWFQSFNATIRVRRFTNNDEIDTTFNDGFDTDGIFQPSADLLKDFNEWTRLSNVDNHFDFFKNLFSSATSLIDFASLRWRKWKQTGSAAGIPALNLYSPRIDDLVQLTLSEILNRLRQNLGATGSDLAAPVVTKLNALQPKIESFKLIQDQFGAFSGADYTPFYDNLKALASEITTIANMPAPSTPLVDATKPNTLNRAHITAYMAKFTTYITDVLTTDIGTIFTNIKAAIGLPNAKRHFYFNIRLPFRTDTSKDDKVQYVVFHINGAVSDAVKSYLKCQWIGNPSQTTDMHNFIDTRTITDGNVGSFVSTAALVESDTWVRDKFGISPLTAYATHIKST